MAEGCERTFLVIGDDRLRNRLPNGVDLRSVATALHADAQIHDGKALAAQQQDRLEDLVAQHFRLDKLDGAAIDLDQATAFLAVGDRDSVLLPAKGLDRLHRHGKPQRARGDNANAASERARQQARTMVEAVRRAEVGSAALYLHGGHEVTLACGVDLTHTCACLVEPHHPREYM